MTSMLAEQQCAIDQNPGHVEKVVEGGDDMSIQISIYVAQHCSNCDYAREVAQSIQQHYPQVEVELIDMETTDKPIPDSVFATPTYLLNGRVWSLGNPSQQQVDEALTELLQRED